MSMKLCKQYHRDGLTLVEVVAALALAGTLLVGMVNAHTRLARQTLRAKQTLRAVTAADALLLSWHRDNQELSRVTEDEIPGYPEFKWRKSTIDTPALAELECQIIRISFFDGNDQILFDIDLVVPADKPPVEDEHDLPKLSEFPKQEGLKQ